MRRELVVSFAHTQAHTLYFHTTSSSQVSRITDGSEGGFAGLAHHAARRLQTTNVKAQRCFLRMRPHTPCINSSNAPLVAPLDHLAGTRTFHRHQHHHTPSHVQHRPLFRCGDGTFNFKDSQPLQPPPELPQPKQSVAASATRAASAQADHRPRLTYR